MRDPSVTHENFRQLLHAGSDRQQDANELYRSPMLSALPGASDRNDRGRVADPERLCCADRLAHIACR